MFGAMFHRRRNPLSIAPGRKDRLGYEHLEDRIVLTAGLLHEAGDFAQEIARLKDLVLERDSHAYVPPTAAELAAFESMAADLLAGDVPLAVSQAEALGYEVVEFSDASTGAVFHALREQSVAGATPRGWGAYFVNLEFQANTLVEVPHPLFDTNSWEIGAEAFLQSAARGFLMAGAHRHANGFGAADVAHLEASVFQSVHQVWTGDAGETSAWQIHGFDLDHHDGDPGEDQFPSDAAVVTSNGNGDISAAMAELDGRLQTAGLTAYAFNSLDALHDLNQQVNDGVAGATFSSLAATTNVQGSYSRQIGGDFVHVELEQALRLDAGNREIVADVLSESISASLSPTPPATKFFVADTAGDDTFAYDAAGNLLESYSLDGDNTTPRGVAAHPTGQVVWVVDNDDHVYVYDASGNVLGQWEARGLSRPEGIATDGEDVWIVDRGFDRVFFFEQAATHRDGSWTADAGFDLASGNSNPRGVTTDGARLWVVNWGSSSDSVFQYAVDGSLLGSWDIDASNDNPRGITIDPQNASNLWIVDNGADAIFQYLGGGDRVSGSQAADAVFQLADGDSNPQGIADPPATESAGDQIAVEALASIAAGWRHESNFDRKTTMRHSSRDRSLDLRHG